MRFLQFQHATSRKIPESDCLGLRNILCLFICACAQIFSSDLSCLGGNAALLLLVPAGIILWQMAKRSRHTWCRRGFNSCRLFFLIRSLDRHDLEARLTCFLNCWHSSGVRVSALAISGMMLTFSCNRFINSMSRGFSLVEKHTTQHHDKDAQKWCLQSF